LICKPVCYVHLIEPGKTREAGAMNAMKDKPARGVAPQRAASPERISIAARVSRPVHERLTAAASFAGRSLSEEIEQRLEASVKASDLLAQLFGPNPDAVELLRLLSQTIEKVRRMAKNRGLGEIETRQALHAAFRHLGEVYFWHGQEIEWGGHVGSMDKPPVATIDAPPAAMGYEVADFNLFWNDARAMEEYCSGHVSNVWSGDGQERVSLADRQPEGEPLSNVLRGDNRADPVAPAAASEAPAKPVRRRARFTSRGPRFHVRRDPSRAHQTAH
jgi:hypothetical protein